VRPCGDSTDGRKACTACAAAANTHTHSHQHARLLPSTQASAPRRTPLRIQNLRVNNVEIPNGKRVEISLQYIYGIGQTTAQTILRETVRVCRCRALQLGVSARSARAKQLVCRDRRSVQA